MQCEDGGSTHMTSRIGTNGSLYLPMLSRVVCSVEGLPTSLNGTGPELVDVHAFRWGQLLYSELLVHILVGVCKMHPAPRTMLKALSRSLSLLQNSRSAHHYSTQIPQALPQLSILIGHWAEL